jgi:hypothetical protein
MWYWRSSGLRDGPPCQDTWCTEEEGVAGRRNGADLIIVDIEFEGNLLVDQVWKLGKKVYD